MRNNSVDSLAGSSTQTISPISDNDNGSNKGFDVRYLHFFSNGQFAFIGIDKEIINQLHLTDEDGFTQEITEEGILLRRQRNSIN